MKKRTAGIILSYVNTFMNMICGLLLSSFLLNKLGDTEYGIYQTMSSFANYLVLLEFGAGTVLSRNLSACKAKKGTSREEEKIISTVWSITNVLSLAILLVSVVFYFSMGFVYSKSLTAEQISYGKEMFVFIVVFLLSSFYSQTLNGIALANEHYSFSSIVSITKTTIRTILLVSLIFNIKKAIIIAIVDACINVCIAVFTYFYCRVKFRVRINFNSFDKVILQSSLPLCLAMLLQTVVTQTNNILGKFILGIFSGPEDVALYSVGLYIFGIFSSISTIPVTIYMPKVTKDVIAGFEGKELTEKLIQPNRLITMVSGTILFGFISCGRQFVELFYGKNYSLAWAIAIILMAPMFVNMSNAVVLNVLDVKNKRLYRSLILMGTTALNIGMTIIGVQYFGIIAAAIATGIATLLQVIILNIYYHFGLGLKIPQMFAGIFKGMLVYQVLGAAAGYFVGNMISNIYISFFVAGLTYVAISFGGFALMGMNKAEKTAVKNILAKIKSKVKG